MTLLIAFGLGYVVGGISALILLGLTVTARHADRDEVAPSRTEKRVPKG